MHSKDEKILISWCDNGMVHGKTMDNLLFTIIELQKQGLIFSDIFRANGNQISRQRQAVLDYWENNSDADWIFIIDSDIAVFPDSFIKIWNEADKDFKPIVCGIYFLCEKNESHLPSIYPSIYKYIDKTYNNDFDYIFNEIQIDQPKGKVLQIDAGGFGYILMHRSILKRIKEFAKNKNNLFAEFYLDDGSFVGEDVAFFLNAKAAGIPVFAHTGAFAEHMKSLAMSHIYFNEIVLGRK